MASENKKVFVVFGATGIQGGSVANAILHDPVASQQFKIRAITRDPSKPAAVALAQQGAELAKADMEDKDSLRLALKNAYAVFFVTNFFEKMDPATETTQGKNVADIAKELDIKHLIWSSLPHVSKITNNKLTAAVHFESKALVNEHIRSLSIPHTIVEVGTYIIEFFLGLIAPLPTDPPSYGITLPEPASLNYRFPLIHPTTDVGKFIKAILLNPDKSLGRQLSLAYRHYSIEEIVKVLNDHGLNVAFQEVDKETFKAGIASKGLPLFVQEDMIDALQFGAEYGFASDEGVAEAHKLVTEPLVSLEEALKNSPEFAQLLKK